MGMFVAAGMFAAAKMVAASPKLDCPTQPLP
jgi:hypothetical protein